MFCDYNETCLANFTNDGMALEKKTENLDTR